MGARGVVIRRLLRDSRLRRLELAFSGFNMAEYGVWVAVLVYAYNHGGVNATAAVAVAQLVPAGLLAPMLARHVDARGGACALRRGYWCQSATLALTAILLFVAAPPLLVYLGAILAACAVTMTRPAQASLVPALAERSEELTAINVISGWVEAVSVLVGPALAGGFIALDGPKAAIAAFALCIAGSALVVPVVAGEPSAASTSGPDAEDAVGWTAATRAVRGQRCFAEIVALLGAQYLVIGMLDVLLVVLAVSALGLGDSGAGYLNAAFGSGGIVGSVAALSLVGRRGLVRPFLIAAAGWAVMLVMLGLWTTALGAFLLLAAAGATRTLLDVSGRTLLLGAASAETRSRVFGMLEGTTMFALAAGSLLVPVLVSLGGVRTALVTTGALLSAITIVVALRLRRGDVRGAFEIRFHATADVAW